MCLLVAGSRIRPDLPLVVAANRDEWLERPAEPMQVLRSRGPRVLGGRDLAAGGTWLAVNRRGVVAALTNRPAAAGRDATRRSRGEIPLLLAAHRSAAEAASALAATLRPEAYNPCWILVGDRDGLLYLEIAEGRPIAPRSLPPGLHVLENRPLDTPSPKVDLARRSLPNLAALAADAIEPALQRLLASHEVPPPSEPLPGEPTRPPETFAACVHAGPYGTRSSTIVLVPRARRPAPLVRFTRGPPCAAPFEDASGLW